MKPTLSEFFAGRMHYAWVVLVVMFLAMLAGVGVRAAPGVMILPLERAFGWSVGTISAAVSINIILMGFTGPFLTGLVQVIGLKRTILGRMIFLAAGTGLSLLMSSPWQLFLTWGVMVGIGAGAGAVGMAAAVANRWFVARSGLAMGLLSAANAAGQLIFLPLLAVLAERYGWEGVAVAVTVAIAAAIPVLAIVLPESPGSVGLGPYGMARNPTADSSREPVHDRHDDVVPGGAVARFLAAHFKLRNLRFFDQWAYQHVSDRLLRRSRDFGSDRGQRSRRARGIQSGRRRRIGLAVRSL